jgi:hypothetical protein
MALLGYENSWGPTPRRIGRLTVDFNFETDFGFDFETDSTSRQGGQHNMKTANVLQ